MRYVSDKYEGLELSPEFIRVATESPEILKAICNGVGSQVGLLGRLTYHLLPNTIWFMDITPASDVHDLDYNYPDHFKTEADAIAHKLHSDIRFYHNMCALIKRNTKSNCLKLMRYRRARAYYWALRNFGTESFLEGKIIDKNE